jgi:hypothetical protein
MEKTLLLKVFQKVQREGILPNSFYETGNLKLKPDNDASKKESNMAISLMKTVAKILNIILANAIQQHIEKKHRHEL